MPALISHTDPAAVFAYDQGQAITVAQYLAAVHALARQLPEHGHVLNLCSNRYHFAVVMGAALLRQHPMLLPSTRTPAMLSQLGRQFKGFYAVADEVSTDSGMPCLHFATALAAALTIPSDFAVPQIDAKQIAAYIFTSGSTGAPIPHAKSWGKLVLSAKAEGEKVRQYLVSTATRTESFTVTGTVPAQHMFGFESTVLMPMQTSAALDASHPFFPADIDLALRQTPAPHVLITTPFHLRTLLDAQVTPPQIALMISATAPLSPQLAKQAELTLGAPLLEIYGCTEAGQLATRRTTQSQMWETYSDISIAPKVTAQGETHFFTEGGHIEGLIELGDVLELESSRRFKLIGRHADMINVAGKRSSLAFLNHLLNSINGVIDGVFYLPESTEPDLNSKVQRLSAFVVAPTLNEAAILAGLREHVDPLFLPRPVYLLDQLPRNETGKLPQQTLAALAKKLKAQAHD